MGLAGPRCRLEFDALVTGHNIACKTRRAGESQRAANSSLRPCRSPSSQRNQTIRRFQLTLVRFHHLSNSRALRSLPGRGPLS